MSNVLGKKAIKTALKYNGCATGSAKHLDIVNTFNTVKPHGYTAKKTDYWCDIFVSAIWIKIGLASKDVPLSCNVDQSIDDAKNLGIFYGRSHKPRTGDAIILDWDVNGRPNHIGLVASVTDKYIHTIEGNAGDKGICKEKTYALNANIIYGYICPRYNAIYVDILARKYAWAKGTDKKKYSIARGGKPTKAFKTAWEKYFPKNKLGSGCHQFAMLVLRASGRKVMPLAWDKIIKYLKNRCKLITFKSTSQLKKGDIFIYRRVDSKGKHYHIMIIVEIGGKLMIAEAQQNKTYAHINTSLKKLTKDYNKVWVFRQNEK